MTASLTCEHIAEGILGKIRQAEARVDELEELCAHIDAASDDLPPEEEDALYQLREARRAVRHLEEALDHVYQTVPTYEEWLRRDPSFT